MPQNKMLRKRETLPKPRVGAPLDENATRGLVRTRGSDFDITKSKIATNTIDPGQLNCSLAADANDILVQRVVWHVPRSLSAAINSPWQVSGNTVDNAAQLTALVEISTCQRVRPETITTL